MANPEPPTRPTGPEARRPASDEGTGPVIDLHVVGDRAERRRGPGALLLLGMFAALVVGFLLGRARG